MTIFVGHFSHNKQPEVEEEDLYELFQGRNKPLRKYLKRFDDTKASVPNCRKKTAVSAFVKGLVKNTRVHIELTRKKPKTFFDLFEEVEGWIAFEDDLEKRRRRDPKGKKDQPHERENPISGITPCPLIEGGIQLTPRLSILRIDQERHARKSSYLTL